MLLCLAPNSKEGRMSSCINRHIKLSCTGKTSRQGIAIKVLQPLQEIANLGIKWMKRLWALSLLENKLRWNANKNVNMT